MTLALVVVISASDLSTSDSSSYAWSTPDGYLISANSADAENGELVTSMRVNRNDDGDWVSYGTFQGKPIEQVIDGEQAPHSDLGSMMLAKQLFAGEDASVSFTSWLPSADPTRFVDASISRSADMPEDVATISLGPIVVDGQFDEHGSVRQASMQMGPIQVLMERTWVDGTP